ncbi:MAG: hypothetical protein M1365_02925, partial [Actinobacteria bacterium]|nr:hypothetical protein [Actinomycetota bacterium]
RYLRSETVIIIPDKKVGSRQKTCGSKECQQELKRRNNARWRKNNPDHWRDDYVRLKTWLEKHPDHLKGYRKSHPEYVSKCRDAQKRRDRSKRLHLDIQAKIRRQAPDIINQLWDKSHLDNLDKDEAVIKPLETILLLSLLP